MKKNKPENIRKENKMMILDERSVEMDPFIQFTKWFEDAITEGISEPNAMFLATAGADGKPSGRIVLLKEFNRQGFIFYTNYESRKGKEISENPNVALTFHWKELGRQVRIAGTVERVSKKMSDDYFDTRPFGSQLSASISPQSRVINDRKFLEELREQFLSGNRNKKITRPEHWGGFLVKPVQFEFWQERESRLHDRLQFRREDDRWIIERLAP
jgi:pyridoxamine 5'-phosphate oxidase